jgi:hypothetical protein
VSKDLSLKDLEDISWAIKDLRFRLDKERFAQERERYGKVEDKVNKLILELTILAYRNQCFAQIPIRLTDEREFRPNRPITNKLNEE